MDKLMEILESQKIDCKGLVYRCRHTTFMTNRGYEENLKMNLLKKISCRGCENCGGILEMLEEYADQGMISIPTMEDGALYTIKIFPAHQDQPGDWDSPEMEFTRYKLPTITEKDVIKGQRVKYIPDHAHGDPTDKRCELGCIKIMAPNSSRCLTPAAFVLYDNIDTKMITGDEDYTAIRTRLENLILI